MGLTPVPIVLVGAGQRGADVYGAWIAAHNDVARVIAVVEPDGDRRSRIARLHGVDARLAVADVTRLPAVPAVGCIVAGPDRTHHASAMAALDRGWHVLVEKPLAATLAECEDLVAGAARSETTLSVAFVLRSTRFFRAVRSVVEAGTLGRVISIALRENVAAWHMAHSFVRGNWAVSDRSTPMIVSKSCHDLDVLAWLAPSPVSRLSSVGSLIEFRPEMAPRGATERCTDPCPVLDCPYDARRIYLDRPDGVWPVSVLTHEPGRRARLSALETGPYGVCAFRAQSDVVDHQAVLMELEDGADVTFTMHGHAPREARTLRIDGTRATLRGRFASVGSALEILYHTSGAVERIDVGPDLGGHGGGDDQLTGDFVAFLAGDRPEPPAPAVDALEGHRLAFLAEEARLSGSVIDVARRRVDR